MYGGAAAKVGEIFSFDAGTTHAVQPGKKHRQKHLQEAKKQHRETVARSMNAQLLSISSEGSVYCCWRPSGRTGWRGIGRSTAGDFGGELGEVS